MKATDVVPYAGPLSSADVEIMGLMVVYITCANDALEACMIRKTCIMSAGLRNVQSDVYCSQCK